MTDDTIPETTTALDQALRSFEASEAPFYDGLQHLKQAAAELRPLLANRTQYMAAKRALNVIAAGLCETDWRTFADPSAPWTCEDAVKAMPNAAKRCWSCYARHVLNGGEP